MKYNLKQTVFFMRHDVICCGTITAHAEVASISEHMSEMYVSYGFAEPSFNTEICPASTVQAVTGNYYTVAAPDCRLVWREEDLYINQQELVDALLKQHGIKRAVDNGDRMPPTIGTI